MAKMKSRKSASLKEQAVLRLLKGEDMELVSRQTGFAMHELAQWREKYTLAGREGLKSHPQDPHNAELEQRDKLISRLALENEILKKARAIAVSRKL
jgi:5-methylthioribose kinase